MCVALGLSFAPVDHAVVRLRSFRPPFVNDAMVVRLSNFPVYVLLTGPCRTAAA